MADPMQDAKVAAQAAEGASDKAKAEQSKPLSEEDVKSNPLFKALEKEKRKQERQVGTLTTQVSHLTRMVQKSQLDSQIRALEQKVESGKLSDQEAAAQRLKITEGSIAMDKQGLDDMLKADAVDLSNPSLAAVKKAVDRGDHATALQIYEAIRPHVTKDDGEEPPAVKPKALSEMSQEEQDAHIAKLAAQQAEGIVKQFIKDTGRRDLGLPGGGSGINFLGDRDALNEAARKEREAMLRKE